MTRRAARSSELAFVAKHRSIWPAAWLCEALNVSRSGFHAWLRRGPSSRTVEDEALAPKIQTSFVDSARTYGARRVWRDVLAEDASCGLHKIERLMRENALRARPRRRGLPKDEGQRLARAFSSELDTGSREDPKGRVSEYASKQKPRAPIRFYRIGKGSSVIAPNVLDRQFTAERPNQKWIADFTYVWTAEGWLYVAAVIDLFSRRVVGWSMKAEMTAQLVTDALVMAIWRRGKSDALLHHSDQGGQYTSEQFQRLMADNGVICSMSRSGNVWDDAARESFFSSLKTERICRKVYRTRHAARADAFDYIERFYNSTRRRSTIGYLSRLSSKGSSV